jgi:hypothetical protein
MNNGTITLNYSMAHFRLPIWRKLLEKFRRIATHLAQTDVALKEGKALEQLQGRLVGFQGVTRIEIEDSEAIRNTPDIDMRLVVNESFTPEEESRIRVEIAQVSRRHGIRIRCSVADVKDREAKEAHFA